MYYTTQQKMAVALESVAMDSEQIRETIQCPLPQVDVWPPLTGYGQIEAVTVAECMEQQRVYPDSRYDFSGSPAGWAGGTPTPSMGVW
jgi:hypothetical protein